jgi:hypothetical protein
VCARIGDRPWGLVACFVALVVVAGCGRHRCKPGPIEVGQICPMVGATGCQGNNVLTCPAPAEGNRCSVWAPGVDCSTRDPGPLSCGVRDGTAVCQCPAPAGNELRVDPAVGGSARSGLFASGVTTPEACRFRQLGDALAAATRPGTRVVIASDPSHLPVTLAGESFPLEVGKGITVTAESPDRYRLAFDGAAAPAAVRLGAEATLEGITIAAARGNPAASAVTCAAGPVTLRSIHLVGMGAGDGTQRMGTGVAIGSSQGGACAATMSQLAAEGFGVAITVNTEAPEASTLNDACLKDVTTAGVLINAGRVVSNRLTIEKPAPGGAAFGVLVDGISTASAATLEATMLLVSDTPQPALEIRAGASAVAPQVSVAGGQIRKAGLGATPGVRQLAGNLALNGTSISESGGYGLRLMGGAAALNDVRLEKNGDDGLHMEGGALMMTGFVASRNGADGVDISGGQAQLEQGAAEDNAARGLYFWGGVVAVEGPLTVMNNGRSGPERGTGLRFERGNLTVKGVPGAPIEIGNSGLHGINIEGPGPGGSVTISGVTVWGSGEYGVNIDLTSPGGRAFVADLDVHHNGYGGVAIRRAPSREVDGLVLRNLDVHENGTQVVGPGIWVRGDAGPTLASIVGAVVEANSDCGVRITQGAGLQTEIALHDNIVRGNNTAGRRPTGGIFFETPATLTGFTGNRVFANKGDQIGFAAPPNGGGPWKLGPVTGDCAMTDAVNQISCYGGDATGIRVVGDAAVEVDASAISWQTPDPAPGRDYVVGPQGKVVTTGACPPAMMTCP